VAVTYVTPAPNGVIDPDDVRRALRPATVLISVMHANNETGAIQPLADIARLAREAGVALHSDGVQAVCKIPVDVEALGVDLYALSGHKIGAPKGTGALYVRKGTPLAPLLYGGHHERDRRAGTENVPGAAAFARAASWVRENLPTESTRLAALRDRLEQGILERVPHAGVNARGAPRLPNTTNIWFEGIEGEALVIALDLAGFAVSSGSACSSGAVEPSHVLTAMGVPAERARASLRFSLGRSNTTEQVDALLQAVAEATARLRKLSPTYVTHA
jgi:cysteine desulfurase